MINNEKTKVIFTTTLFILVSIFFVGYLFNPAGNEAVKSLESETMHNQTYEINMSDMAALRATPDALPKEDNFDYLDEDVTRPLAKSLSEKDLEYYGVLNETVHDIASKNPVLAQFLYYQNHVLLDEKNQKREEEFLSSPKTSAMIRRKLLYPGQTKEDVKGNVERMIRIDYFRKALAWTENPARAELLTLLEDMILEDNFISELGTDMRLSLASNKMELFELLFEHDSVRAEALVSKLEKSRIQPLIEHIANVIRERKKLQNELLIQVNG